MTPFRILVVDDEEDIVASLGGLLRDEGYEVISAGSGEDGLSKAVGVDLVVLDLMLPGIDGLETLRRIKERDASLPVIMMSGHGTVTEAVKAVQAGAYDFLEKPLSGEKVLVTVENALKWRRLQQKNKELEDRVRQRTAELEETNRTVQAQNELLEAQNRRLTVERAIERVRGEVLLMRRTEDIGKAVAVVRGELRELGINWDPCRIDVEEETGRPRLVVEWNPLGSLSFSEEDIGTLERFAEVVSMGYTRFLDLQARKERRRALARETALERVRAEVTVMDGPEDLETVVALMVRELDELGVPADAFVFAVMDEETRTVRSYGGNPDGWYGMREDPFGTSPERVEIWRRGEPVMRSVDPALAQKIRETARRMGWKGEEASAPPKVVLDAPFSHGLISINSVRVERFSEEDIQILADFAEVISLGYARFLDFQRLEEQNRALEEANRQIQKANQAKSEFLAKMSHELRTPMNSILGFADLMKDGIFGEIPEVFQEPIDEIHKSGNHLLALINDVLDLSKIEAGRMELHLSECAVEGCVESVAATMRPLAEEKGLEVVTAVEDGLPTCTVDEGRITQVLLNLAGNAVKFTEQGEVELGIRKEEEDLFVWVRDTGIGIPSEKLEEIFTEFSQVDASITRNTEGTGLGLSISRHIVEMHGGEIGVESEVGKGSTFWFRIPM